ncbi:xanthine dehydrogenase accessory protein XdhC [Sphingopyxis sp.]|uniref:xanthine dehydrogenase accessory protein XdhC n=1 Tax=Sphingopyxis sp. TaxID=1908224 RepID=UPI002EDB14DA
MADWIAPAKAALAAGRTALVSVLATEGSAPRGAGTRMIVTDDAIVGTIGGGRLEHQAIDQARTILSYPSGTWRVQDYPLGPLLGQCCGGRVRLLIEHLDDMEWANSLKADENVAVRFEADRVVRTPTDAPPSSLRARGERPAQFVELGRPRSRQVQLFGAGHVGKAIARALQGLPFSLAWFDTRTEMDADGVTVVADEAITDCVRDGNSETIVLILTHDHGLDYRLVVAAMNSEAAFIGLIGSKTKRARFLSRLAADGFDKTARARLTCPIGISGIDGNEPDVIAIAVVAQLLRLCSPQPGDAK